MSFLAPLFLAGALAIALPFWLHRLQTESSDRKPFSSAMLLEPTQERIHVRRKLRYLALLALRVVLLAVLVLAFARPLWTASATLPGPGPDGTHLVVVDTSMSMSRNGTFDAALELARDAIGSAPRGAMLQVLAASHELREVTPLSVDRAAHAAALRTLQPDATRLDFGQAMTAIDRLAESVPAPVTLHLVSDLQGSSLPTRFSDLVSTRIAALQTHVPLSAGLRNWSIDAIRPTATGIDVVVTAVGDDDMATNVELTVNGAAAATRAAGGPGTTTVGFTGLALDDGDNRIRVQVEEDDELAADSTRYHVVRIEPPAPIPVLTSNARGLPVTYLAAALQSDPASNWQVLTSPVQAFDARTLPRFAWIIVDDTGSIDPALEAAIAGFVENGGGLLAFVGRGGATATRVPVLGNAISGASIGPGARQFLSIGQVDAAHPLLSATNGWYAVRLSQSVPVEAAPDDDVLIRLENGEPFLIERRIGRGRVLLVTGGLENQWNDLPARPVFAAFLVEAARYLSGAEYVERSFAAGAALPLALVGGASGQVIDPDGNDLLSLADTTRAQRIRLDKTGFYEVYTPQGEYAVAVNPDPRESDLAPVDGEALQRWVAAMSGTTTPVAAVEPGQTVDPVELWHALLLILALVLIAESVLANLHLAPGAGGRPNP